MEKGRYSIEEALDGHDHSHAHAGRVPGDVRIQEAAELYGDIETAEEYGYVTRRYA